MASNKAPLVAVAGLSLTLGAAMGMLLSSMKRSSSKQMSKEWVELLTFWFDGDGAKLWFLKDDQRDAADALIRSKYQALTEACERGEKNHWADDDDPKGCLALILVLDQLARHVWRGDDNRIQRCGVHARDLTEIALIRGDYEKLRGDELSFLLMPFRHEKPVSLNRLERVLSIVDARERRALTEKAVLSRFKRVTESRLSEARAEYEQTNGTARKVYTDEDILEPHPPIEDECARLSEGSRGPVYKVVDRYLEKYDGEADYIMVSLSGGVDSMVLIAILHHLLNSVKRRTGLKIVAAHVDYGNRGESHAEADFVHRFCEQLGIHCVIHRIQGLLRGVTDREEYEEKSREIRFDLYKRIWNEDLGQASRPIVLFGHHEGDVVENVLSNSMKGKTILELSGMTEESIVSGCVIRRPLLPLTKNFIFDYAHRFGVPYFKDTTPRWSTRGQVRLEVLPCLERVYGKGFQAHLARLAEQSDEAFSLLSRDFFAERVVSSPMLKDRRNGAIAFAFDLTNQVHSKPLFLWRLALRKAAHEHGVLIATDKAVKFLYDSLAQRQDCSTDAKESWFAELRRGSRGYVWENRYLLVFRYEPDVIVPYDAIEPNALILDENDATPRKFGFWTVSVQPDVGDEKEYSITMDDLWKSLVKSPPSGTTLTLRYSIPASDNSRYRLVRSRQVISSVQVEIQLRGALLPQVFAEDKTKTKRKVTVVLEWVN